MITEDARNAHLTGNSRNTSPRASEQQKAPAQVDVPTRRAAGRDAVAPHAAANDTTATISTAATRRRIRATRRSKVGATLRAVRRFLVNAPLQARSSKPIYGRLGKLLLPCLDWFTPAGNRRQAAGGGFRVTVGMVHFLDFRCDGAVTVPACAHPRQILQMEAAFRQ